MSFNINRKLRKFTPYQPICGEFRIRLDANESFIAPDDELIAKITDRITSSQMNRYPDPYASEVCSLFADFIGIKKENIVAGNGSDEIISIIVSSFFEKGDKILTFSPDFSMYAFYAHLSELEHISVHKEEDMVVDIEKACDFINMQNIKGVILSNPCNPTSIGISSGDIIKLAERTNALVVIDEAYMEFYGDSVIGRIDEFDNLVVLKTCSKALGLAGIRLGFALACEKIINAIKAAKSPYNVNMLTQHAGAAALSAPQKIRDSIAAIIEAREFLYSGIIKIAEGSKIISRVYPTSTNFVFMKTIGINESENICGILRQNEIVVRQMGEFIRVTAGSKEENASFLDILSKM